MKTDMALEKKLSTELAALDLVDRISGYVDTGKIPISIFLALPKAFDTLDSYILLEKLKHYGFCDVPLKWFHFYLLGRSKYVVFNGSQSGVMTLSTGIPQGSVLGPLLFKIYMNDMHMASKCFKAFFMPMTPIWYAPYAVSTLIILRIGIISKISAPT